MTVANFREALKDNDIQFIFIMMTRQPGVDKKKLLELDYQNKQVEPNNLTIFPIFRENVVIGLIEIATFKPFEKGFINKIDDISKAIGNIAPI